MVADYGGCRDLSQGVVLLVEFLFVSQEQHFAQSLNKLMFYLKVVLYFVNVKKSPVLSFVTLAVAKFSFVKLFRL